MGNRKRFHQIVPVLALIGPLAAVASDGVAAGDRQSDRSVTACSRYGNGCYTAAVRKGRFGPEMRLSGGTWIDCEGSCIDTLRQKTIDFWETERENKGGDTR